ncbi:MAG: M99 family carboxypeptidase catalytic domain-containing protein [candidate division WOR-3 bacterium]
MADYRRICSAVVTVLIGIVVLGDAFSSDIFPFPGEGCTVRHFFQGSRHEVLVHVIRGAEEGPVVLIIGGIHGDEPASHMAADKYTQVSLAKGSLVIVPRLNRPAVVAGTREGRTGDMNRLFHLPETKLEASDRGVVSLAKLLIAQSDYVVNLHQGSGFYDPSWISQNRNPSRWGQSYVIDTSVIRSKSGERLDLLGFAMSAAQRSNATIGSPNFRFHVRNTGSERDRLVGKEQHKSLTFFAVSKASKIALGVEATKSCSQAQAVALLATATDSVLREAGLVLKQFPSEQADLVEQVRARVALSPGARLAALGRRAVVVSSVPGRPNR